MSFPQETIVGSTTITIAFNILLLASTFWIAYSFMPILTVNLNFDLHMITDSECIPFYLPSGVDVGGIAQKRNSLVHHYYDIGI